MGQQEAPQPTFSFVSSLHNEQGGLEAFYKRLSAVAARLGEPYEIIFVNDGSQDDTDRILRRLAGEDPHVKIVDLSRSFGASAGATAGIDHAGGRAVICLDADGQHPLEVIPQLVARWREGFEVVCTVCRKPAEASLLRRAIARALSGITRLAGGTVLAGREDFFLLDGVAVAALKSAREHGRCIRGMLRWIGFRQAVIPFAPEPRPAGHKPPRRQRPLDLAAAGVFNFSLRPLRLMAAAGGALLAAALLYTIVSLLLWPFGAAPGGLANLAMAVVALFGLQFLMFGLLGEYVGRIFEEAKARPLYIVRQTHGFAPPGKADKGQAQEEDEESAQESEAADNINIYT